MTTSSYRLLPVFTGLFVACLIISNIAAAAKLIAFGPFVVSGGIIVFPLSYIFGDILTEVYGYAQSRKVIWTGFGSMLLATIVFMVLAYLPAPPFWQNQEAYQSILGFAPRIFIASIAGYFCGEFCNSFAISKMKYWVKGKRGLQQAWRFVLSTIVGEGVDSIVFAIVAFAGILSSSEIMTIIVSGYILKVLYEVVATPLSVYFSNWVKRAEGVDQIDRPGETSYNPFVVS